MVTIWLLKSLFGGFKKKAGLAKDFRHGKSYSRRNIPKNADGTDK